MRLAIAIALALALASIDAPTVLDSAPLRRDPIRLPVITRGGAVLVPGTAAAIVTIDTAGEARVLVPGDLTDEQIAACRDAAEEARTYRPEAITVLCMPDAALWKAATGER